MENTTGNVGKKTSSNFKSTKPLSHFLLKIMAEQVRNGMKSGQDFKNKAITVTVKAISNEFPGVQVSESNVLNHLRTLKNKWSQIKRLKDMSRNGWDDNAKKKNIMDEEVYRTYVQAHPKEEPFITKPIELFEEMFLVCGGGASGKFSKSVHSVLPMGSPMETSSIPIANDINDVGLENVEFFGTENNVMGNGGSPETQNVNSPTPTRINSTATKNGSKKRKREEEIQVAVSEVAKGITRLADAFDRDKDIESMVLDAVMTMEDKFPMHILILASDYLADNKNNIARVFLKRTSYYQEGWVAYFANRYVPGRNLGGNGSGSN